MKTEERKTAGLYIHVPFCRAKCPYCDFYSLSGAEQETMDAYVDAALGELAHWTVTESVQVDTVYLGGGTPSMLGGRRIARLIRGVGERADIAPGAEVTVEANPDSADGEFLALAREAGANRLSLGVQAGDDQILSTLGRLHTFAEARQAVSRAREAGFSNLSLDLMYGLPGQNKEEAMDSLRAVLSLAPEHLSAYALKLSEESPMGRRAPRLPPDDEQADFYLAMVDFLDQAGYRQYEISNFAKPGFESRHNRKYWALTPYLGLGPGAHSYWGGKRFFVPPSLADYLRAARAGGPWPYEGEPMAPGDRGREAVMLALRTREGLDEGELGRRHGVSLDRAGAFMDRCAERGLARREGTRFSLTPAGFFVSSGIIAELLDRMETIEGGNENEAG